MAKAKAKQKAKDKKPVKAAKTTAKKAETSPDWLRKAMAVPPKRKGRPPGSKNRPKIEPQTLKRGRKPMATKPYDPLDDPDLRADTKGDLPPPESPIKPPDTGLKPDNALPGSPSRPGTKPAPLPGGGVRPDNALPEEPEAKYDEVASGEVIPAENAQMLIAGTLGGSGDNHASAKRILARFEEAGWEIRKALDAGTGDTKGKTAKKGKEADERKDDARR